MNKEEIKEFSKLKQKKYREENKKFLVEGVHLIEECLRSKYYRKNIEKIFLRNDFKDEKLLNKLRGVEVEILKPLDFKKLSETENPQGIIGVVFQTEHLPAIEGKIICAIDNVNDPGNLGTILRLCWWFGIENVLISKNSVELYNSKVIRSSQGALFNLLLKDKIYLPDELKYLHDNNFEIIVADIKTDKSLGNFEIDKNKNYVLVFGNEANGISDDIKENENYNRVKIDAYTNCESLNVATSAAIFFYEFRKNIK
jgi:RNA methyltransferase, TrmH family